MSTADRPAPPETSGQVGILRAVQRRYSAAAQQVEPGLCCPVQVDSAYLDVIPAAVRDRDYGCGDPVSHVRPGETVLDLGSGSGKVCFVAAQIVGPRGHVTGVDANPDMLALARPAQPEVARRLGYSNVTFARARIEDLRLDLEFVDDHLARHPVTSAADLATLQEYLDRLRTGSPLIPDRSVDVVISNCVLNLVGEGEKRALFGEIARVLRPGGRTVVSDIVADRDVPAAMRADPDLWSGCYSGALRQDRFLTALIEAGLHSATVLERDPEPWRTIGDVKFRSITVTAQKSPSDVDGAACTDPARSATCGC